MGTKLSFIRDTPNGTVDYVEVHAVQTNANGLMTLSVGQGNVISGSMTNVDCSNHTYYLKIEIDPAGGTNYTISGVQVIAAVPFAQHAASADYTETQVLSVSNDTIFLTGGTNSFVKLPNVNVNIPDSISSYINNVGYITADSIPKNISYYNNDAGYITSYADAQQLTLSGDTLKLERGGSIILSSSCTMIDTLKNTVDSLNNGIDSLNNIISTLESIICKPQILTNNVTSISSDTAVCGGYATSPCDYEISKRGVCWNTTGSPNLTDSCTSNGSGIGNFASVLTGLSPNTYYVRAYLISGSDTIYGNEVRFAAIGVPVVKTVATSNITKKSAVSGGIVTSDGRTTVTQRGICWSTSNNPTVADNHTSDGSGVDTFASNITGLLPSTTYYVRAYAINAVDTAYGEEVSFTTVNACDGKTSVTDIDNNVYNTVIIGTQCWMKENMKATSQPDNASISEGYFEEDCGWVEQEAGYYHDDGDENFSFAGYDWEEGWDEEEYFWMDEIWHDEWCLTYYYYAMDIYGMAYCNESFFVYPNNNSHSAADTLGILYNWAAAMNGASTEGSQGICPDGWHVPTLSEFNTLISYVSSTSSCSNTATYTAKALASQANWVTSNNACAVGNDLTTNNASGFSAEPAGSEGGSAGYDVSFWLSTESKGYYPYYFDLNYSKATVSIYSSSRDQYRSVRCIKN